MPRIFPVSGHREVLPTLSLRTSRPYGLGLLMEQTRIRFSGRNPDLRFDRMMPGYHDRLAGDGAAAAPAKAVDVSFLWAVLKVAIFLVFSAIVILAASRFYGRIVSQAGNTTDMSLRQIVIGNDVLEVPANMIRYRSQRHNGTLARLDLHVHWPTMTGFSEEFAPAFNNVADNADIVFATIEPREMSRDMSGRISVIYENFFAGLPVEAGNGLVRRAFSVNSAYGSEDLYYEAGSPYPFAARCIRESDSMITPFCMRDIHIGRDLMLTYRFHRSLLPEWMALDRAVRQTFGDLIRE